MQVRYTLQLALEFAVTVDNAGCESMFRSSCSLLQAILSSLERLQGPVKQCSQSLAATLLALFDTNLLGHFFRDIMSADSYRSETYTALLSLVATILSPNIVWAVSTESQQKLAKKLASCCFLRRCSRLMSTDHVCHIL